MKLFFHKRDEVPIPHFIDIHSHILPGIDDGSRSEGQALAMLQTAEQEGIGIIIATPHNMPGKGNAERDRVLLLADFINGEAERRGMKIRVLTGCEIYYRQEVPELLEEGTLLTMNGSDCVLVEFDYMASRSYIRNAVKEILGLGCRPILAHAERYPELMERDFTTIRELRKMHTLIQVNASSVTGNHGTKTQKDVAGLLKQRLVDFVATDAHSNRSRGPYLRECREVLVKMCGGEYARELLYENASKLLIENK